MNAALAACVSSLALSNETLQTSNQVLGASVADYPRLKQVLQSNRHFDLLSHTQVDEAQYAISSTIQPELDRLLREAEKIVHKLQLKERKLEADSELYQTRIDNSLKKGASSGGGAAGNVTGRKPVTARGRVTPVNRPSSAGAGQENAERMERLKRLRAQKQRLAYAVERLELEKRQKEMQMKKSMSYSTS